MWSVNRSDEVFRNPGDCAKASSLSKEEESKLSTIAGVVAAHIDEVFKVDGQVVGTQSKGLLVKYATGAIHILKR